MVSKLLQILVIWAPLHLMCPRAVDCSESVDSSHSILRCERVPGVLILKLRDYAKAYASLENSTRLGITGIDSLMSNFNARSSRPLFPALIGKAGSEPAEELSGYYVLNFPESADLDLLLEAFAVLPEVERVEFDCFVQAAAVPNDPYFAGQWGLAQPNRHDIRADKAWEVTAGSSDVILASVDTGVLYDHEDLRDNIWVNPGEDLDGDHVVWDMDDIDSLDNDGNGYIDDLIGWDFVDGVTDLWPGEDAETQDNDPRDFNGHGTHTAGTMAAVTNNGVGVAGVAGGFGAGGCRIMCLRIGYSMSTLGNIEVPVTRMSIVAQALYYAAANGAAAINYSFLSGTGGGIEAAADFVTASGSLIVSAAGNSSNTAFGYLPWRSDVITVAAVDSVGRRAWFTSFGSPVDLTAPGVGVLSTYSAHHVAEYRSYNGTSASAPHVTGVIGLIRSVNPAATRGEIITVLANAAVNLDTINPGYERSLGVGRVDAEQSVKFPAAAGFSASPVIGQAPLLVQFADQSLTSSTGWQWDFGDGANSMEQSPAHVYDPGLYSVTLETSTPHGQGRKLRVNYIAALAETVTVQTVTATTGDRIGVPIDLANAHPLRDIVLPVVVHGVPEMATLDSFVVTDCRAEALSSSVLVHQNFAQGRACLRMRAQHESDSSLSPGRGAMAAIWLTMRPDADPSAQLVVDTATLGSYSYHLAMSSPVVDFTPVFNRGKISISVARGDINSDGVRNVLDVILSIEHVFGGGAIGDPARVDVSCDGQLDIVDVVTLIGFVFRGGLLTPCQ